MKNFFRGPNRLTLHRPFDLATACVGLLLLWPVILLAGIVAAFSTREGAIFQQQRVGRHGKLFSIIKLRTMKSSPETSTVTTSHDPRITRGGSFLRRFKLDELPQLWNVVCGDMSFVGPRPDVPGFADELDGRAEQLLIARPGITGPATMLFKNEEKLLATVADPERTNDEIIFPAKTAINLAWLNNASIWDDFALILLTVVGAQPVRLLPYVEKWEPGLLAAPPLHEVIEWIGAIDKICTPASAGAGRREHGSAS